MRADAPERGVPGFFHCPGFQQGALRGYYNGECTPIFLQRNREMSSHDGRSENGSKWGIPRFGSKWGIPRSLGTPGFFLCPGFLPLSRVSARRSMGGVTFCEYCSFKESVSVYAEEEASVSVCDQRPPPPCSTGFPDLRWQFRWIPRLRVEYGLY